MKQFHMMVVFIAFTYYCMGLPNHAKHPRAHRSHDNPENVEHKHHQHRHNHSVSSNDTKTANHKEYDLVHNKLQAALENLLHSEKDIYNVANELDKKEHNAKEFGDASEEEEDNEEENRNPSEGTTWDWREDDETSGDYDDDWLDDYDDYESSGDDEYSYEEWSPKEFVTTSELDDFERYWYAELKRMADEIDKLYGSQKKLRKEIENECHFGHNFLDIDCRHNMDSMKCTIPATSITNVILEVIKKIRDMDYDELESVSDSYYVDNEDYLYL